MAESKSQTTSYVTIHLDPENVEKWFEIAEPVFEKIKAEPSLVFFELYRSPDDPGAISWLEKWGVHYDTFSDHAQSALAYAVPMYQVTDSNQNRRSESQEWLFEIQLKKDYYTDYFAATEPLFVKPREVRFLSPVGSPFFYSKS